jgi:predicted permease
MSDLSAAFLGALQGTIAVLLTLLSGFVSSRVGLLDPLTIRRLSKLCSNVFLPSLIITQVSPAITIGELHKVWMMPVWGLVSSILAHFIGFLGKVSSPFCEPNADRIKGIFVSVRTQTPKLDNTSRRTSQFKFSSSSSA